MSVVYSLKGGHDLPARFTLQIQTIASRLAALYIVSAYTGAISSFILIPKFEYPFSSLQEFVEDGSYQLGYIEQAVPLNLYSQLTNDLYLQLAYEKFSIPIQKESDSWTETITYVYNQMCKDHKFTFVYPALPQAHLLIIEKSGFCKIIKIPLPILKNWVTLQLREQSPYLRTFNRILKMFKSSGVFKRIQNYIFEHTVGLVLINWNSDENMNYVVEISNLKSIFLTITILYIISVTILLVEIIFNKIKK